MRRLLTLALALAVALNVSAEAPATAGTLTSATWSTAGTGYAVRDARNTTHDYAFTTAGSATLTKVTASLPSQSYAFNERYLSLTGGKYSWLSTLDAPANSITGDIDLRIKAAIDWRTSNPDTGELASKWDWRNGGQYSWLMNVAPDGSGRLQYIWNDGTTTQYSISTLAVPFTTMQTGWARVTMRVNNGGARQITLYTSTDGTGWTQLGAQVTGASTQINDSTAPVMIGNHDNGDFASVGRYYDFQLYNGVSGTLAQRWRASLTSATYPTAQTAPTGELWSVYRGGGSVDQADIVGDLVVSNTRGIPNNGAGALRLIDQVAEYRFAPTSITAGTPISLSFTGISNTPTAGTYTSTLRTYDNASTPSQVDSAVTNSVTITDAGASGTASVTVDPFMTFSVVNRATACNGLTPTVTSSATAVDFGRLSGGGTAVAAQNLNVSSNTAAGQGTGITVYLRGTAPTASRALANVSGTNASPSAFPVSAEAFGYTLDDDDLTGSPTNDRFTNGGAKWAGITSTAAPVMDRSGNARTNCVAFQIATTSTTPAGTYTSTIYYTAVPRF